MWISSRITLLLVLLMFQTTGLFQGRYAYQKRGNRYEGIRDIKVAAPDFELLSFIGYREEVPPDSNVILKLKFFMPSDTNLYITAKELIPRRFYFMKSAITYWQRGWQEFVPWPTSEVIEPISIKLEELGIVARLHNDRIGTGHIAPLIVYHTKSILKVDQYLIQLKSKETLSRVRYTLYKAGSRKPIISETIHKTILARVPFPISLDLSDQGEGEYRLIVKCRIKDRIAGPNRTYSFYHNPVIINKEIE